MSELLTPLAMKVDKSVQEVGDACTQIEEVDQCVIEVEVEAVWHVILHISIIICELLILTYLM